MRATGIPPHLVLATKISSLADTVTRNHDAIRDKLQAHEGLFQQLPKEMVDEIDNRHFRFEHSQPVQRCEMATMIEDLGQTVGDRIMSLVESRFQSSSGRVSGDEIDNHAVSDDRERLWNVHTWGGRVHYVEEGWAFPSGDMKQMWELYLFGNPRDKIPPFEKLSGYDCRSNYERGQLSRLKFVMNHLIQVAVTDGLIRKESEMHNLSIPQRDNVFRTVYDKVISTCGGKTNRRVGELKLKVVYENLKKPGRLARREALGNEELV